MERATLEIGKTIKTMEKEYMIGQVQPNLVEHLKIIPRMDKE